MKKALILCLSLLLAFTIVGCQKAETNNASQGNPQKNSQTESNGDDISIVFQSTNNNDDRVFICSDWLDSRLEYGERENKGYAICLVTVADIDLDNVKDGNGIKVPLTLNIDKVISKNNAFDGKANETVVTTDWSLWKKSNNDFVVSYGEGSVPITETNMQYIAVLFEADTAGYNIDFDIDYLAEAYTIPIVASQTATSVAELFQDMRLPDDVRKLSIELITQEFGESYIPSISEIEKELKKINSNVIPEVPRSPIYQESLEDIVSASVTLLPPDITIELLSVSVDEFVTLIHDIRFYEKDESWQPAPGQVITFVAVKADGSDVEIRVYDSVVVVDGIAYKCNTESCEALRSFANRILVDFDYEGSVQG